MSIDLNTHGTDLPPEIKPLGQILLVEDSVDIRRVATLAMERVGHFDVLACATGEEGIREANKYRPGMLLLNIMMPKMDGPMLLKAVRAGDASVEFTDIPAIFLTAKIHSHEIAPYLAIGALAVLSKPFEPMSLAQQIRKIWAARAANP